MDLCFVYFSARKVALINRNKIDFSYQQQTVGRLQTDRDDDDDDDHHHMRILNHKGASVANVLPFLKALLSHHTL